MYRKCESQNNYCAGSAVCNYCFLKVCAVGASFIICCRTEICALGVVSYILLKKGTKPITLNKMKLMLIVAFAFIVGASAQCDVQDCLNRFQQAVSIEIIMSKSIWFFINSFFLKNTAY